MQHAEENWAALGDAERRIFQDIARGVWPLTKHRQALDTISSTWLHGCGWLDVSRPQSDGTVLKSSHVLPAASRWRDAPKPCSIFLPDQGIESTCSYQRSLPSAVVSSKHLTVRSCVQRMR